MRLAFAVAAAALFGRTAGATLTGLHVLEQQPALGASAVAVSPDGAHVYTGDTHEIRVWVRDGGTGALSPVQSIVQIDNDHRDIAVSPDGAMVYVVTGAPFGNDLLAFERDAPTGMLTLTDQKALNDPSNVVVSPDGAHVYATEFADSALSVFRSSAGGALVFVQRLTDDQGGADGLHQAFDLAVSPDGANVYVDGTPPDGIGVFARDAGTGTLSFLAETTPGGVLAPTPDGTYLLAAAEDITTFLRAPGTGLLSVANTLGKPSFAASAFAVAPDGTRAFLGSFSFDALTAFGVDASSGALTVHHTLIQGQAGALGLADPVDLAVSPDGRNVYVVAGNSNTVVTVHDVACSPTPRAGCATPGAAREASLAVRLTAAGTPSVRWTWKGSVAPAALGDPLDDTGFALCVYDGGSALVVETGAPGGGSCGGAPCWKATTSTTRFSARIGKPAGLKRMILRPGTPGKLTAGGNALSGGGALPFALPVTVQLQRLDDPACWTAAVAAPAANTPSRFKGRSD